jgi:hypothetical protein
VRNPGVDPSPHTGGRISLEPHFGCVIRDDLVENGAERLTRTKGGETVGNVPIVLLEHDSCPYLAAAMEGLEPSHWYELGLVSRYLRPRAVHAWHLTEEINDPVCPSRPWPIKRLDELREHL